MLDDVLNGIRSVGREAPPRLVACQSARGAESLAAHRFVLWPASNAHSEEGPRLKAGPPLLCRGDARPNRLCMHIAQPGRHFAAEQADVIHGILVIQEST